MKPRVLVVEDDLLLARVLRDNLAYEGYEVACVADGNLAVAAARDFAPDLVVLDVMLPGRNGFDLVPLLRRDGETPVVMLTALGQKADKLKGLDLGADDYVTKPFDLEEFLARVRAVLRRAHPACERLVLGEVAVDFAGRRATRNGADLRLTDREFALLKYLAEHARVVLRAELLKAVWQYPEVPETRSVDHAIARLRKKIEPDHRQPRFIHTVHGDGYRLTR